MDITTQSRKFGYRLNKGKKIVFEHLVKKQPMWFGIFAIGYGIFKLAVNPSPIFGTISIACGIAILILGVRENQKFEIRNLNIKHIVSGNNKIAIEYKTGRVDKFAAADVVSFDVKVRRGSGNGYVGTLSLVDQEEKKTKLAVVMDKDESKIEWYLEGVAQVFADKLNEEVEETPEAEETA